MQNYLGYFDRNWTALFNSRELDADSSVKTVSDSLGLEMLTSKILKIRGYDTVEKAETFLKKRSEMLHDPFIMKDMEKDGFIEEKIASYVEGTSPEIDLTAAKRALAEETARRRVRRRRSRG